MTDPELDYAFLANYASVHDGVLTAVEASFTKILVEDLPTMLTFSVAGRIRADANCKEINLGIELISEDTTATLESVIENDGTNVYGNKVGLVFAAQAGFFAYSEHLCQVKLSINGTHVRTLKFDVTQVGA